MYLDDRPGEWFGPLQPLLADSLENRMAIQDQYLRIPLERINVAADRQRRTIDTSDLISSIRTRGVIQPIIVEPAGDGSGSYNLIAGERRFKASQELSCADIPARLAGDLSHTERQIIELEENVKRKDLPWQDEVLAVQRIHKLYTDLSPEWTLAQTGDSIGLSKGVISIYLAVGEELSKGNKNVLAAQGMRAAYNTIARKVERGISDAMNDLLSEPEVTDGQNSRQTIHINDDTVNGTNNRNFEPDNGISNSTSSAESILNQSFHDFAQTYSGPPFNFLHCDFPYGINHDKSDQGNSDKWGGYEDSEDTYWALCQTLCTNLDRLVAPSSHILFWLSSDIERQIATIRFFAARAPGLEFRRVPLIWLKTDNKGILPDPKRGPRQIYESALFASRGDRLIVRSVSNAYGSPGTKEIHQSEKPEPMLRHFFSMFVDENTRLLDPTCGSATSLRAAEALGASQVLGLEINPDHVDAARVALKRARILKQGQEIKV